MRFVSLMSEQDLQKFIQKVNELNKLINSLDQIPGRRDLLSACKNHDEVIRLTNSWGYKIGRRWGEKE